MSETKSKGRAPALMLVALAVAPCTLIALTLEQFVAGWPIELRGNEAFYEVPLTSEQYAYAGTLDHLAILDATGDPMPFYRAETASPDPTDLRVRLGVSPVYRALDRDPQTQFDVDSNDLRARISVAAPREGTVPEIVAYVADARDVEQTITAIELDWQALDRPFLLNVRIEHSQNLTDWRTVGRGSIAALAIEDMLVSHGRIPISAVEKGFYRITWGSGVTGFMLEGVELSARVPGPNPVPRTLELSPMSPPPVGAAGEVLYFDAGGILPTQSVRPVLVSPNRWIRARIESSTSIETAWRPHTGHQLFYRIGVGERELASSSVMLGRVEARYWRVVLDGSAPPPDFRLQLKYPAETLRFAAQGTPPYMLVAGTLVEDAGPDRTLEAVLRQLEEDSVTIGAAELGARRLLGGDAALATPFRFPWRTALLWATLGFGVLIASWMAVRLARDLYAR